MLFTFTFKAIMMWVKDSYIKCKRLIWKFVSNITNKQYCWCNIELLVIYKEKKQSTEMTEPWDATPSSDLEGHSVKRVSDICLFHLSDPFDQLKNNTLLIMKTS